MSSDPDHKTMVVIHGDLFPQLMSALEAAGLSPSILMGTFNVWTGTEPANASAGSGNTSDVGRHEKLLLTVAEAAEVLGIGRTRAYELIHRGELEVVHIGRSSRVPAASLPKVVKRLRKAGEFRLR